MSDYQYQPKRDYVGACFEVLQVLTLLPLLAVCIYSGLRAFGVAL